MHENKGLWGVMITCMALGMGYFTKEASKKYESRFSTLLKSSSESVGVLATLGTIFGALSVYFLGKEVSLRQNPRLIHQLRKVGLYNFICSLN